MTTPLFLLRCTEIGISIVDLDFLNLIFLLLFLYVKKKYEFYYLNFLNIKPIALHADHPLVQLQGRMRKCSSKGACAGGGNGCG